VVVVVVDIEVDHREIMAARTEAAVVVDATTNTGVVETRGVEETEVAAEKAEVAVEEEELKKEKSGKK
jgi:hypothetical protein